MRIASLCRELITLAERLTIFVKLAFSAAKMKFARRRLGNPKKAASSFGLLIPDSNRTG